MATAMGLFDWLRPSAADNIDDNIELAALSGRIEALVDRMRRHAAMCRYPQMRSAVEQLAERQTEHLKSMKAILADRDLWARPPEPPASEGSNDWGRLSNDLNELATLGDDLHRTAIRFEAFDAATAKVLHKIAAEDSNYESELRKIALKCDPQAID
ncbi:MAG TPA: hypothetical protein VMT64_17035 [Candidatus Binataceae bacterium]|nr:hypothetical protein [Candidatus Binataceae bacterium]